MTGAQSKALRLDLSHQVTWSNPFEMGLESQPDALINISNQNIKKLTFKKKLQFICFKGSETFKLISEWSSCFSWFISRLLLWWFFLFIFFCNNCSHLRRRQFHTDFTLKRWQLSTTHWKPIYSFLCAFCHFVRYLFCYFTLTLFSFYH